MKKTMVPALVVLLIGFALTPAQAQDQPDEFSKKVLDQVEKKLKAHREGMLKAMSEALDRELGRRPGKASKASVDDEIEALQQEVAEMKKRLAEIEGRLKALTARAGKPGKDKPGKEPDLEEKPEDEMTLEEARELFQEGYDHHQAEEYDEAIALFTRIAEKFPTHNLGYTSAYNIACAYSLKGEKGPALKWLEKSIQGGFRNFDHIEQDTDLDNVRNEKEYQRILDEAEGMGEEK